jgi:proliferating cell nuclear antigen
VTLAFRIPVATLSDAVSALKTIVDEAKFRFSEEGLGCRAVDPANVSMSDLHVDAGLFDRYQPDDTLVGIDLNTLSDVLGMAQSNDDLIAELNPDTKKLDLAFPGSNLNYTLALIDPESIREEPDMPGIDLPSNYVLSGETFSRGLRAADLVSDHLSIVGVSGSKMRFQADGDTDSTELTLDSDSLIESQLEGDAPVSSMFSLGYLNDMTSPIPNDAAVRLRLGDELPIRFRYSFESDVDVKALIAPRIQGD